MFTYLLINLISVAYPLAQSFESRLQMYRKWKYILPAMIITAVAFICWDIWFTQMGVWGFNSTHLIGIYIFNLPIEEVLFFICIPYACIFIYDATNYFIRRNYLQIAVPWISGLFIVALLTTAILYIDRWYTGLTFILVAMWLIITSYFNASFLGRFYLAFGIILIPFLIVNGLLTGSFIHEEVVWYNNAENLGIRIGTIPIEDIFYGMLLVGINITLYHLFQYLFNHEQPGSESNH